MTRLARRCRRLLVPALVAVLAGACASAPPPAPDPALHWADLVGARVVAAQVRDSHPVRYNPAACDCPPYELQLDGSWHRVAFAGVGPDDPAVIALDEARRDAPGAVWQVQGALQTALATCARGAIVVTMALSAFGPPPVAD